MALLAWQVSVFADDRVASARMIEWQASQKGVRSMALRTGLITEFFVKLAQMDVAMALSAVALLLIREDIFSSELAWFVV
jgi:hypothetical protein